MAKAIPDGLKKIHVLRALADLDEGVVHPFGPAVDYELLYEGTHYAPKAVVGLAFKHLDGRILGPQDFRGGKATGQANAVLKKLGFEVVTKNAPEAGEFVTSRGYPLHKNPDQMAAALWYNLWPSKKWPYRELQEGNILYWFDTKAQAIVWKSRVRTVDRFEYADKESVKQRLEQVFSLDANIDFDSYFENASRNGYCLAYKVDSLFALQVPKPAGYRFPQLGWLRRGKDQPLGWLGSLPPTATDDADIDTYRPTAEDRREIALRGVRQRQGQPAFRKQLFDRYGRACMISGCTVTDVIEAAHIRPYRGEYDNDKHNGLLLRSDLHSLFDAGLLIVKPETLTVRIDTSLLATEYAAFNGVKLRCGKRKPSDVALRMK